MEHGLMSPSVHWYLGPEMPPLIFVAFLLGLKVMLLLSFTVTYLHRWRNLQQVSPAQALVLSPGDSQGHSHGLARGVWGTFTMPHGTSQDNPVSRKGCELLLPPNVSWNSKSF